LTGAAPAVYRRIVTGVSPGDYAPDAVLEDAAGRQVRLSDFWRTRPTVLVFLRHFG
jgi:peroxiredoxin